MSVAKRLARRMRAMDQGVFEQEFARESLKSDQLWVTTYYTTLILVPA